jgi:ABC-2 type transport system permease protein
MMIVAPVIALSILNIIFGSPDYVPLVLHEGLAAEQVSALREGGAEVESAARAGALDRVERGEADGFVLLEGTELRVWLEGTDPSKTMAVMRAVQELGIEVAEEIAPQLPPGVTLPERPEPDVTYVHGSQDMRAVDFYGPVFIGVFVFFFVFITSGISFVRERTGGTLERLMATPIKRWELVLGYVQGFGLFSLLQTVIVAWASIYWVGFPNSGEFWLVLLIAESMALVSLTLGILVSEFANTELQVMQLMQIIVIPQILLSGMFDLSQTPAWMQTASRLFPLTYGADAMRAVMLRGERFAGVASELAVLWTFAAVFIVGNILTLKKYRRA